MKKTIISILTIVIIAIGFLLWNSFGSDDDTSLSQSNETPQLEQKRIFGTKKSPNLGKETDQGKKVKKYISPTLEEEVYSCMPDIKKIPGKTHFKSINRLSQEIVKSMGKDYHQDFDWSNTHLTLPNGEKRRIRLYDDATAEGKTIKRLQVFGVDAEDLPVPINISEEEAYNPTAQTIRKYTSQGIISYREKAYTLLFPNDSYIRMKEVNGKVSEFEVHFDNNILKCMDEEMMFCECY